ncbi:response regulator transcription factor [Nocardioides sp.]|uniref:response regulator transcription factor n=1 Tax=Nocardioides sp. TaxID=35761 RepID=UPI00356B49E0
MVKVLIVDDDVQLTRALHGVLDREGYEARVVGDAETALEALATEGADMVVLDLRLPDRDGVEVVRRLRTWSEVPVLVLSAVTEQLRRVEAFDAGADDFLQKPFGVEELLARMRALARRAVDSEAQQTQRRREFGDLSIDLPSRSLRVCDEEVRLTPTEWRLLEVFSAHPGRLLTHRWLLDAVWDRRHGDESKASLRAHIRGLRSKLQDDATEPRYIRTDSGLGYRWIASEPEPKTEAEIASEAERDRLRVLGVRELVHELGNAVTALRIAVKLVSPGTVKASSIDPAVLHARLDDVTDRVSLLSVEVQQRLAQAESEDS